MLKRDRGKPRIKGLYTYDELAEWCGVPRKTIERTLGAAGISPMRQGRSVLVPLSELKDHAPNIVATIRALAMEEPAQPNPYAPTEIPPEEEEPTCARTNLHALLRAR